MYRDPQTGKQLTEPLQHDGDVYSAQFSPDGTRVVTDSVDKTTRVWDAQSGKQLAVPCSMTARLTTQSLVPTENESSRLRSDKTSRGMG